MQQHSVKLYEKEHALTFSTKIISIVEQPVKIVTDGKPTIVNALGLIFCETIFHPQGGGQPSDKGTINGLPILTVKEDKTQVTDNSLFSIYHFLDAEQIDGSQFEVDQSVELIVDENFRQQCQRSHSAGHLIADILEFNPIFNAYHAKATHGHHFPGGEYIKVIIDKSPENPEQLCHQINGCINEAISIDLPVAICSEESTVRHIKIGDSKRMCGGTHVKSTKEIEQCHVTKVKTGKNKEGQIELTIFYNVSVITN